MLSPQEKIDEIHSILVKWERRRKWNLIFVWVYRLFFFGFICLLVFFPGFVWEKFTSIITPILQTVTHDILEAQKEKLFNFSKNF